MSPVTLDSIDSSYSYPVRDEWRHMYGPEPSEIVEHVFVGQVDGCEPVLSWEHDDWRWSTYEEALGLLKWPDNIEALKRCERLLKSRD